MDREIEMEECSNDRIAQRFPFGDEDELSKSEIHRVQSDSDYSSYVTSSVTSSPERLDSSGNSDEGIELSIPLSSPSKLQQDDFHHANQTRNRALYTEGSEIKSIGIVWSDRSSLIFKTQQLLVCCR